LVWLDRPVTDTSVCREGLRGVGKATCCAEGVQAGGPSHAAQSEQCFEEWRACVLVE